MNLETHLAGQAEDVKQVILRISDVAKTIRGGFATRQGASDASNVYGEQQAAMDVWADELLISELRDSGLVRYVASEERPDMLTFQDSTSDLGVTIDPLDGSSLIGVNLAVGTIVGIYRGNLLSPGNEMLGAMYILYGPLTTLTYSLREGVHEFALNDRGVFCLQEENITIPEGKIYAPGALRRDYLPAHRAFIEKLEEEGYKLRYSGSFVADVHQILHKGGVFTYPPFAGNERGKLRLLFEAIPMGFIVSQAGGSASDGRRDLLSIKPEEVTQRVPVYIGGKREIELIVNMNKE
ncbi:fructose-1,6-bisphosphatase [Candidatus Bathyarchaeota archaeon]|nr:fructose-1,6-bisphosphatase [Candidatus Bathyarchaeota archaeon]MBL7080616.1 fructose-1,6-bisphosphatase [Candidatus Bathyarchaeota archaeon]